MTSCFFHQSFGRPVPAILEAVPLVTLPAPLDALGAGYLGTVQGSSELYPRVGTGACTTGWYGVIVEVLTVRVPKFRDGMGSAFSCANAATRSMLTSVCPGHKRHALTSQITYLYRSVLKPRELMQQRILA